MRSAMAMAALLLGTTAALAQLGGFREALVSDKDVIAAADAAVDARKKEEKVALAKILKAETQVVAGRNFRLLLDLRVEGGLRTAQAVVWHKLDGTRALTKWEWKGDARAK